MPFVAYVFSVDFDECVIDGFVSLLLNKSVSFPRDDFVFRRNFIFIINYWYISHICKRKLDNHYKLSLVFLLFHSNFYLSYITSKSI